MGFVGLQKIYQLYFVNKSVNNVFRTMHIITLTTDFGERDYSVGALKGKLYSLISNARIVDISHQIELFNIMQAAYVLRNAYKYFPTETIHIIGIDDELHSEKSLLIAYYQNQYFICADNGFFSLLFEENIPCDVYKIPFSGQNSTFPTLDFATYVAEKITLKIPLEQIGERTENHIFTNDYTPFANKKRIDGKVIYIDHYGNVISNISKKLIEKHAQGRRFDVFFKGVDFKNISIQEIYTQYNDIEFKSNKKILANEILIFNQLQHLELAIYRGNPLTIGAASTLFGIEYRSPVSIQFIDNQ
ncbi:SAM hydrolase/SAM-dependent halogenase family protein [Capnocytophaga catalasegens]|nr:SAM-dependent chlorinase/fluorinase [Capnocytophaga catalasegens]